MKILGHLHQLYAWWLRRREQHRADDRAIAERPEWSSEEVAHLLACLKSLHRNQKRTKHRRGKTT